MRRRKKTRKAVAGPLKNLARGRTARRRMGAPWPSVRQCKTEEKPQPHGLLLHIFLHVQCPWSNPVRHVHAHSAAAQQRDGTLSRLSRQASKLTPPHVVLAHRLSFRQSPPRRTSHGTTDAYSEFRHTRTRALARKSRPLLRLANCLLVYATGRRATRTAPFLEKDRFE